MNTIPLRLKNGKPVGYVSGGVATIDVESRHWFRAIGGYSIDLAVLRQIEAAGVSMIHFRVVGSARRRRVPLRTFMMHAARLPDYGYGVKLACSAEHYLREDGGQLPLLGNGR